MNQQKKLLLALVVVVFATMACTPFFGGWGIRTVEGSGNITSEERQVSGFDRVELSGIGYLEIEFGEEESLTIEAEDNLLEYIETTVRGQKLSISIESDYNFQPTKPIKYYLTVVDLESVQVSGLGDVRLPEIEATEFSVDISGGGNVEIDRIDAKLFEVDISGLGDLDVDGGTVVRQVISISGGGNYKARRLESQDAEVDISGLGNATLRVSDTLDVKIGGGGNVNYYGNPTLNSDISGLGDIERVGD